MKASNQPFGQFGRQGLACFTLRAFWHSVYVSPTWPNKCVNQHRIVRAQLRFHLAMDRDDHLDGSSTLRPYPCATSATKGLKSFAFIFILGYDEPVRFYNLVTIIDGLLNRISFPFGRPCGRELASPLYFSLRTNLPTKNYKHMCPQEMLISALSSFAQIRLQAYSQAAECSLRRIVESIPKLF